MGLRLHDVGVGVGVDELDATIQSPIEVIGRSLEHRGRLAMRSPSYRIELRGS